MRLCFRCFRAWKYGHLSNKWRSIGRPAGMRTHDWINIDLILSTCLSPDIQSLASCADTEVDNREDFIKEEITCCPPCPMCNSDVRVIIYKRISLLREETTRLGDLYKTWLKSIWRLLLEETLATMLLVAFKIAATLVIRNPFLATLLMITITTFSWLPLHTLLHSTNLLRTHLSRILYRVRLLRQRPVPPSH